MKSVLEKNGMKNASASKATGDCGETPDETAKKVKDREKKTKGGRAEDIEEDIELREEAKKEVDKGMVRAAQKAVGELTWLVTRTRPDIAYTVHRAATFTLGQQICKRLLR